MPENVERVLNVNKKENFPRIFNEFMNVSLVMGKPTVDVVALKAKGSLLSYLTLTMLVYCGTDVKKLLKLWVLNALFYDMLPLIA